MKAVSRETRTDFYVVGGTMRYDAPSYVERQADQELLAALVRGEFCYVLTARQMGKSSLMLRTAAALRAAGGGVVVLDLTAIGQNLTAEQWYCGLLVQMGDRLQIEDDLLAYWEKQAVIGPMQRWMKTLREVVVPGYPGRLVIFIDEIDAVRSLGFATDEFFAGIRECYNLRNEDHEIQRLTFCLLGVATPSDLIRDTRTTPFNIGTRIDLNDFTEAEALPLADGLHLDRERNRKILKRILYWTSGHPYLTQRICQAVVEHGEDGALQEAGDLDRLVEEMFFSKRAQEYDDNLIFVRERLLRSGADLTALLGLYSAIRRRKRVPEDEANPLVTILRLSGITRVTNGLLQVRNRIYERVFNDAWVASNLPDFEIRRQRQAYRRGVWRTAIVSALILAIVAGLALVAVWQRNRAVEQASVNRRLLYLAQMKLANEALEKGNISRVRELLDATRPHPGEEDLRSFEWSLLYSAAQEGTSLKEPDSITTIKFLPGTRVLAIGSAQQTSNQGRRAYSIKLYDLQTRSEISSFSVPAGRTFDTVAFSPDLQQVATDTPDNQVVVSDLRSGQTAAVFAGHENAIKSLVFAPGNRYVASADLNGVLKIWDTATKTEKLTRKGSGHYINDLAFSPDGRLIAATYETRSIQILDAETGRDVALLSSDEEILVRAFFSGDGRQLAAAGKDGRLYFWDLAHRQKTYLILPPAGEVLSFSLSPDGKMLATGAVDRIVRLWDVTTGEKIRDLRGHGARVTSIDWSSDGKLLATGDTDGVIKIWNIYLLTLPAKTIPEYGKILAADYPNGVNGMWSVPLPVLPAEPITDCRATAFSADGELLAVGKTGNFVKLWNLSTGREILNLGNYAGSLLCAAFSKDARTVATGSMDHLIRVFDIRTGQLIYTLTDLNADVYALDFSPDGQTLISGDARGKLKVWDVATLREIVTLDSGNGSYRVVCSPDGKWIASADQDGAIRLWDATSLQIAKTLTGHTRSVRFIAFSPDGRLLATGADDSTLRLWNVETGTEVQKLIQSDSFPRFAFSRDGKRLITGGHDGTVKIWDVSDMQEVITLKDRGSDVTSITFSQDGTILASSSSDGVVMAWQAAAPILSPE